MKYLIPFFLTLCVHAQGQVGINTSFPDATLEVYSTDDGILIPRVALVDLTTPVINTPKLSELVFNTTDNSKITPGFYYWNRTHWKPLIDTFQMLSLNGEDLSISHGNTVTLPAIDEPIEIWTYPTLETGWIPVGTGSTTPGFYKDRGRVYLKGNILNNSATGTLLFTLPPGYQPSESHRFPSTYASFATGSIYVYSNGRVEAIYFGGNPPSVSLDGISFRID